MSLNVRFRFWSAARCALAVTFLGGCSPSTNRGGNEAQAGAAGETAHETTPSGGKSHGGAGTTTGTTNGGQTQGGAGGATVGTTQAIGGSIETGGTTGGDSSTGVGGANATGGTSASGGSSAITLSALPSQSTVLETLQRANGYFVATKPDPTADIVSTDKTRPSNLWTRALYYEGLMALYAIEPDSTKRSNYYDYAVRWGASSTHPWTMTYTAAATLTDNADNQACGQTYIDLYRIDPQPERIAVIQANLDAMVSKKTTSVWTWIDAIQMSMPSFAKLGVLTGDTKYFDAMWGLYEYSRNQRGGGLFNSADGLWWRDYHFTPGGGAAENMSASRHDNIPSATSDAYILAPNGEDLYWSRGNGWVMAALLRVLDSLPTTDLHRDQYIADFRAMANALLPLQRSDGFWTESLHDATHCATLGIPGQDGPETSGTALFVYGLAWGIRTGLLDAAVFGAAVQKGWNGLSTVALQGDGLVGYVQSTGDRPCTGPAPLGPTTLANFDDYGVGCFLLAGSEVYRLAPQ